ncbi:B3 domain-containing protein Os07g0563300-like [Phalaenopsis equestris]|uniref:B3 domain-containing protein Os07g0563300-like n=1 Tax=Phalaenopsis equestris TaxID=78828 RepID=UPI0009E1BBEF|nr:B3 domain-containing protein Os07g0563300-like [Phalaenopsis equestris]
MYVLEGVTPCIQSMQLQAGDTVSFSRIDPEGKLVMGFRKAANLSNNEQEIQAVKDGNDGSIPSDFKHTPVDCLAIVPLRRHKGSTDSINQTNATDKSGLSKIDKTGFIQKDGCASMFHGALCRKKGSFLSSKSKRLRIESEESIELKLTWEEAQILLRPASNEAASVFSFEGHDFDEYEEAPVLGLPMYFAKNHEGSINSRWAQCEDCWKWRRLPLDSLLNHRWTCSDNKWDPERSSCSAAQEISADITHLLRTRTGSWKRSKVKFENENENEIENDNENVDVIDGLDTLANLAILGEGEPLPSSSQPTTKHPRHRPGCTCIVCIQPPSGKGPKHKQTCTCNVCITVKRRFRTLMLRREKRKSEIEAEISRPPNFPIHQLEGVSSSPQMPVENDVVADIESERRRTVPSPIKTQIDLNIQPEREEEPSPAANSVSTMNIFQDSVE